MYSTTPTMAHFYVTLRQRLSVRYQGHHPLCSTYKALLEGVCTDNTEASADAGCRGPGL
jgi:hypothetical protein